MAELISHIYQDHVVHWIIQSNEEHSVGVAELASRFAGEFGMSKSYLSSFFREYTGVNISRYIENVRINAACELLQKGEMNIDQIAGTCGYNSALSFRRAFKRLKGINPSEMKSANKLEGE